MNDPQLMVTAGVDLFDDVRTVDAVEVSEMITTPTVAFAAIAERSTPFRQGRLRNGHVGERGLRSAELAGRLGVPCGGRGPPRSPTGCGSVKAR